MSDKTYYWEDKPIYLHTLSRWREYGYDVLGSTPVAGYLKTDYRKRTRYALYAFEDVLELSSKSARNNVLYAQKRSKFALMMIGGELRQQARIMGLFQRLFSMFGREWRLTDEQLFDIAYALAYEKQAFMFRGKALDLGNEPQITRALIQREFEVAYLQFVGIPLEEYAYLEK